MRLAALLPLLVLAGCAEQDVLQYQGRPAMTALECEAAYEEAKRRPVPTDYSSGAAMIGSAIGKGIGKGMIESHYRNCLARVAGIDPTETAAAPAARKPAAGTEVVPQATPKPAAQTAYGGVPQCSLKMVGGTGYACAYD